SGRGLRLLDRKRSRSSQKIKVVSPLTTDGHDISYRDWTISLQDRLDLSMLRASQQDCFRRDPPRDSFRWMMPSTGHRDSLLGASREAVRLGLCRQLRMTCKAFALEMACDCAILCDVFGPPDYGYL
ncbi:hypothetical protein Droror1_Dr00020370, partial [Drosera rotundifolia]